MAWPNVDWLWFRSMWLAHMRHTTASALKLDSHCFCSLATTSRRESSAAASARVSPELSLCATVDLRLAGRPTGIVAQARVKTLQSKMVEEVLDAEQVEMEIDEHVIRLTEQLATCRSTLELDALVISVAAGKATSSLLIGAGTCAIKRSYEQLLPVLGPLSAFARAGRRTRTCLSVGVGSNLLRVCVGTNLRVSLVGGLSSRGGGGLLGGRRLAGTHALHRRADVTDADVAKGNSSLSLFGNDFLGDTRRLGTRTTRDTRLLRISSHRVVRVKPQDLSSVVRPQTHGQYHTALHGLAHLCESTLGLVVVLVTEELLGSRALSVRQGLHGLDGREGRAGHLVGHTVLDVEALDVNQCARRRVIVRDETGHHRHLLGRVNGEFRTGTEERLVAHTVRVEVAAVLVTHTVVAVLSDAALLGGGASVRTTNLRRARVRRVRVTDTVGLPDIHLSTARAVLARAGVRVRLARGPVDDVGLTADKLQVLRTLRITVARAVLGTSLVGGETLHATVGLHVHEVQSTVQTAVDVRDVHVEGELLVQQLVDLVLFVGFHDVQARAHIGAVRALGDQFEAHAIALGIDAVRAGVVGTVKGTAGGARLGVRADARVPLVSGVAVRRRARLVQPAPVGVQHNGRVLISASTLGTGLSRERRMGLGLVVTNLLSVGGHGSQRGEGHKTKSTRSLHLDRRSGGVDVLRRRQIEL
ncbi:hypothetical protein GQ600_2574 [Phytophthora cactorum]|nr:hypothetical protein GQ600_2574 [Phytophthora cactorum]